MFLWKRNIYYDFYFSGLQNKMKTKIFYYLLYHFYGFFFRLNDDDNDDELISFNN